MTNFTFAEWHAEERTSGHWYVVEIALSSRFETTYGPMWKEMVEPLVEELREIVRCTCARIYGERVFGTRELTMPFAAEAFTLHRRQDHSVR